jgi:DNA-3-methyladenine glycosylase
MLINMMLKPLKRIFFEQNTLTVARLLLNCLLCKVDCSGQSQVFRIVETEAYHQDEPSCHAYQKKTGRAAVMYGQAGIAYVYFIYGMHYCLNVVTEQEGTAGAVLFRALEPLLPEVVVESRMTTNGPAKLTKALNITKENTHQADLTQYPGEQVSDLIKPFSLYLAAGDPLDDTHIVEACRIGITKATNLPWRFFIAGNPFVSDYKKRKR